MELRQLRYLVAISEEQNMNRAAKLCFVTQPALTQQIQKLEEEFNTSILIRRGRGIVLSEKGMKLSLHAKSIMKKIEAIKEEFIAPTHAHEISIGIDSNISTNIDSAFMKKLSKHDFEIKKMCNEQLSYEISKGLVHAGITTTIPKKGNFKKQSIAKEKIYLLVSKHHSLSKKNNVDINSIANMPFVFLSNEADPRKYFLNDGKNLSMVLEVKSLKELLDVVKLSSFIALLPYSLCQKDISKDLTRIEMNNCDLNREYFLIWKNDSFEKDKKIIVNELNELNLFFN